MEAKATASELNASEMFRSLMSRMSFWLESWKNLTNFTSVFLPNGALGSLEAPVRCTFMAVQRALPASVIRLKRSMGALTCAWPTPPASTRLEATSAAPRAILDGISRTTMGRVLMGQVDKDTVLGMPMVKFPAPAMETAMVLPMMANCDTS